MDKETSDLIQAIEDKKSELSEAEFNVRYLPGVINQLENKLFEKLKEK